MTRSASYKSSIIGGVIDSESFSITSKNGLETRTASRDHAAVPFVRTISVQQLGSTYEDLTGDWTVTTSNLGSGFSVEAGFTKTSAQMIGFEADAAGGFRQTGVTYTIDAGIDAVTYVDGKAVFNAALPHYKRSMQITELDPVTGQKVSRTHQGQSGYWTHLLSDLGANFTQVPGRTDYSLSMEKFVEGESLTFMISGFNDDRFVETVETGGTYRNYAGVETSCVAGPCVTGDFELSIQKKVFGTFGGDASAEPPVAGKTGAWTQTLSGLGTDFEEIDSTEYSRSLVEINAEGIETGVTYTVSNYGNTFAADDHVKYSKSETETELRDQYGEACGTASAQCGLWLRSSSDLAAGFSAGPGSKFSRQLTDLANEDITYSITGYDSTFTTPPESVLSSVAGGGYDPAAVTALPGSSTLVYGSDPSTGTSAEIADLAVIADGFTFSYELPDHGDAVHAAILWQEPGASLGASVVLALSGTSGSILRVNVIDTAGRMARFDLLIGEEMQNYTLALSGDNIPAGFDLTHIAGIYFIADEATMGGSGELTVQIGGLAPAVPPVAMSGPPLTRTHLEYSMTEKEHGQFMGPAVPSLARP